MQSNAADCVIFAEMSDRLDNALKSYALLMNQEVNIKVNIFHQADEYVKIFLKCPVDLFTENINSFGLKEKRNASFTFRG